MAGTSTKRWSQQVTERSDARRSRQGRVHTERPAQDRLVTQAFGGGKQGRKSDPFRSAMSMLTFYINRAGKSLSVSDRARLEKAKDELRKVFHRKNAR